MAGSQIARMHNRVRTAFVLTVATASLVGCRGISQNPFKLGNLPAGDIVRTHAKPPLFGYYNNFDPKSAQLSLENAGSNVNQVRTQHVLIASVCDEKGDGLRNRRVEWHVSGVGHLVEVDESGLFPGRGYLVDDKYAVSYTNYKEHTLTRGNDNPADDVKLKPGQTFAVITSDQEGETHVTAYAPGIHDWEKHKKFVIKHWVDADAVLPPSATNPVGVPHDLVTQVMRHSDKTAASGYRVKYQILDGPPAVLTAPGAQPSTIIEVPIDQEGRGIVRLQQAVPATGVNRIKIDVIRPATSPTSRNVMVASGEMQKHWVAPNLTIEKLGPEIVAIGDQITYTIRVANTGQVPTSRITVRDTLPPSLQLIGTNPITSPVGSTLVWQVNPLNPGQAEQMQIVARATAPGVVTNVAEALAENMPPRNASRTTRVVAGKLVVAKTGPTEANVGDPVSFRISIKNIGDGPALNVEVTDSFDPGLATANGAPLVLPLIPRLDPGQETFLNIPLVAKTAGRLCNVVVAKAANLPDAARAQACVAVQQPNMEIVKELVANHPSRVFVGGNVSYTIKVTNTGNIAAQDVIVRDQLPPELQLLGVLDGPTVGEALPGNSVQFRLGVMQPRETRTVGFRAMAVAPGRPCNRASVVFGPYVVQSNEACVEVLGVEAFNVEVLPNKNPVLVGESPSFVIKVLNPGQVPLVIQDLSCDLPPNLQFEAGIAPNGEMFKQPSPINDGRFLTGYRGDIVVPPGRAMIYEVRAKAIKPGISKMRIRVFIPRLHELNKPYEQEQSITIYDPDNAEVIPRFTQSRPHGLPGPVPSLGTLEPASARMTTAPTETPAPVKSTKPMPSFSLRLEPAAKPAAEEAKPKAVIPPPPPALEFPDLPLK